MVRGSVATGLVAGYLADGAFGDPRHGHPVALFGTAAARLEQVLWADNRWAGVLFTAIAVAVPTSVAVGAEAWVRPRPWRQAALAAVCTWAVLGGRSLAREGEVMATLLDSDDLAGARIRLGHLCSRNAAELGPDELARATVESLVENTSDAVVAPLLWGAIAGAPGLVAYRAINTLDAMVGYRSERYAQFGWASARLDDVANLVPSRLTAALFVALAPLDGGSPKAAWRAWRDDAPAHPSPNAGPVEASAAGALGVQLGGRNIYGSHVEDRARLGSGRAPRGADIARTNRLTRAVSAASLVVAVAVAVAIGGARRG